MYNLSTIEPSPLPSLGFLNLNLINLTKYLTEKQGVKKVAVSTLKLKQNLFETAIT